MKCIINHEQEIKCSQTGPPAENIDLACVQKLHPSQDVRVEANIRADIDGIEGRYQNLDIQLAQALKIHLQEDNNIYFF